VFYPTLIAMAAIYAAGLIGYRQYGPSLSGADLAYYALQLFGLQFNEFPGVPVPLALQVARLLAPIAFAGTVWTVFAFVRASLWWRRSTSWRFAIVVGDTAEARAVAAALRRASRRAVFEVPDGDVATLHAVGVRRARTVYALGEDPDDVAANVATALAVESALARWWRRRPRHGPRVFVHVTDPELALGLRARRLMADRAGEVHPRVEFFTMDDVAARAYIEREKFDTADARPEILVAGAGAFGCAIVVEFARRWSALPGRDEDRIKVTLVDENATWARSQLLDRWPLVARSCDIVAVDEADLGVALRAGATGRPYRAYVCYEDERTALRSALAAVPLWHGGKASLVLRLSRLSQHAKAFEVATLIDDLDGRLAVAQVADLAAPGVAEDEKWDIYWKLAPRVHTEYLKYAARATDEPWDNLSNDLQEANYSQARHLATKLKAIEATVAPRSVRNADIELTALTAEEVSVLAPLEHDRWVQERRSRGWRYNKVRNVRRKRHPDLVPWEKLTELSRDKDREAVRGIPQVYGAVLAELGLQIIRLGGIR
jgi:hypothetical protein